MKAGFKHAGAKSTPDRVYHKTKHTWKHPVHGTIVTHPFGYPIDGMHSVDQLESVDVNSDSMRSIMDAYKNIAGVIEEGSRAVFDVKSASMKTDAAHRASIAAGQSSGANEHAAASKAHERAAIHHRWVANSCFSGPGSACWIHNKIANHHEDMASLHRAAGRSLLSGKNESTEMTEGLDSKGAHLSDAAHRASDIAHETGSHGHHQAAYDAHQAAKVHHIQAAIGAFTDIGGPHSFHNLMAKHHENMANHHNLAQYKAPLEEAEKHAPVNEGSLDETWESKKWLRNRGPQPAGKAPTTHQYYDHRRVADHENSMELLHSLAHKALKAGDLDTYHRHMDAKAVHAQMRDEINARRPKTTMEGKVDTAGSVTKVDRQPGVGTTASEVLPSVPGATKTPIAADNEPRAAGEKRFVETHTKGTVVVNGPEMQGQDGASSVVQAPYNKPEGSTVKKTWVQEMADRMCAGQPTADLSEDVELDLEEGKIRLHVEPKLSPEDRKHLSSFFQTMKRDRPSYVTPGHPLQAKGFNYRGSYVTIHHS